VYAVNGTVGIVGCAEYQRTMVADAVCRAVEAVGGMTRFVRPGMRVLLKPNLLTIKNPDQAVTTHPEVVRAVARLVRAAGGDPVVADSPGGPNLQGYLRMVYDQTGMSAAAQEGEFTLSDDLAWEDLDVPNGFVTRSLCVLRPAVRADLIINVPKLKTHEFMHLTGAVKNMFGVIPGAHKAEYHLRMSSRRDFAHMLLDVCLRVRPALTVMDAVVGMEGEGPSAGTPRRIGCIMACDDPFAMDVFAAGLLGMRPEEVPTIQVGVERGLCPARPADVRHAGDDPEQFRLRDFRMPSARPGFLERIPGPLRGFLRPRLSFSAARCNGCGACARACPPKAITIVNGRAQVDHAACIRCFCCHELCPRNAVRIVRSPLARLMMR